MSRRSFIMPRLALALVLALGFGVAWGMAGGWLSEIAGEVGGRQRVWENLTFRADGTAIVTTYSSHRFGTWGHRDLAGNPLNVPTEEPGLQVVSLPLGTRGLTDGWEHRLRSFADNRQSPTFWYLISDGRPAGTAYLVGYDSLSSMCVGFIGKNGFRETMPPPEDLFPFSGQGDAMWTRVYCQQYPHVGAFYPTRGGRLSAGLPGSVPPWHVYLAADGDRLFVIDLARRTVQVVLQGEAIRSGAMAPLVMRSNDWLYMLAVRTPDQILYVNDRQEVAHRFSIPAELRDKDFIWAMISPENAVAYVTRRVDSLSSDNRYSIYWMESGKIVRQEDALITVNPRSYYHLRWALGLILPAPLALDVSLGVIMPSEAVAQRRAESFHEACKQVLATYWPGLVLAHLLSGALALRCYRRQVRFAAAPVQRIVWPIFVVVLGLPGWVGFVYSRSWPTLARCAHCGRLVPQADITCPACKADFPLPALKGTEVFV